jgi:hypothetical protein
VDPPNTPSLSPYLRGLPPPELLKGAYTACVLVYDDKFTADDSALLPSSMRVSGTDSSCQGRVLTRWMHLCMCWHASGRSVSVGSWRLTQQLLEIQKVIPLTKNTATPLLALGSVLHITDGPALGYTGPPESQRARLAG